MFLTISLTAQLDARDEASGSAAPLRDATDLGYLLHKHPSRAQQFDLSVGTAHVFYPEVGPERCTVALLLEVDPIGIVRNKRFSADSFALAQYVNDRPYAASSMVAVALGQVFGTARSGRCDARPDLVDRPLDLEIHIPALPCRGGPAVARAFLEPLGWQVKADRMPIDPTVPDWGEARYVDLRLRGRVRLADALNQLYVLLPVFDDAKHYWVASDEVDKLLRVGGSWLKKHPARGEITGRYLKHRRRYVNDAVSRLDALDDASDPTVQVEDGAESGRTAPTPSDTGFPSNGGLAPDTASPDGAPRIPLARRRADAVLAALVEAGVTSVADLGCGEGALLRSLAAQRRYTRVLGADVSARALERAENALNLQEASDAQRERVRLIQSSLTYADDRISGFDAAVLMEVIEHIDPSRHDAMERAVWGHAAPRVVVVTTPNAEYNVHYPNLLDGTGEPGTGQRHPDHRFEWTREQFETWGRAVATRFGYGVEFRPVGEEQPDPGAPGLLDGPDVPVGPSTRPVPDTGGPSQLAVFTRLSEPPASVALRGSDSNGGTR